VSFDNYAITEMTFGNNPVELLESDEFLGY